MTRRMVMQVENDCGTYRLPPGAYPTPLADALPDIEANAVEWLSPEDELPTMDLETLIGWGGWRWALHVEGAVYFLSGDEPPTADEMPFRTALEPEVFA